MLSVVTKVLIGTAVVVGAGIAVAVVTKEKSEVSETDVDKPNDDSIIKRIKVAATKKAVRILAWVAVHAEQIEATSTVIGLATGVLGIVSAVKEFRRGNSLENKVDDLSEKMDVFMKMYDSDMDYLFDRVEHVDIIRKEVA